MPKFSISLWYKRDPGRSDNQNLLSNGDCPDAQQASFEIQTKSDSIGGKLRTSFDKLDDFNNIAVSYDKMLISQLYFTLRNKRTFILIICTLNLWSVKEMIFSDSSFILLYNFKLYELSALESMKY